MLLLDVIFNFLILLTSWNVCWFTELVAFRMLRKYFRWLGGGWFNYSCLYKINFKSIESISKYILIKANSLDCFPLKFLVKTYWSTKHPECMSFAKYTRKLFNRKYVPGISYTETTSKNPRYIPFIPFMPFKPFILLHSS